ncbi:MAG TPA: DUF4349 domain-containing protein [Pseudonocardia sp.]|uniref:DUF4349 domain-containing protein n=1 Tax=Pseudonocardia sp. TaxID=60912 RepID=UPI002ED7EE8B
MRWSRRAGELVNALPRGGRMMLVGVALIAALAVTWMAAVATVTGSAASAPAVAAGDGIPGRFESVPEPDADPAPGTESAPGGGSGAARYGPELAAPAPTPAGQDKQIAPPGDGGSGSPADPFGGATDRAVVRTARLELTVDDVPEVSGRVRAIAGGAGGFVASEQSVDKSASFALRVPAPRLDEVMGQLGGAGRVTARSEQAADVTGQVADLDGRLATARASVARVRALLDKASTVGDVVMIESELTQREAAGVAVEADGRAEQPGRPVHLDRAADPDTGSSAAGGRRVPGRIGRGLAGLPGRRRHAADGDRCGPAVRAAACIAGGARAGRPPDAASAPPGQRRAAGGRRLTDRDRWSGAE